jgi:hypothetical protein
MMTRLRAGGAAAGVALSFVPRQPETNEHKRIATATRIVSKYAFSSAVGRVVAFEQEELEEREGYKAGMDTSIRSSCGHPAQIRLLTLSGAATEPRSGRPAGRFQA